MEQIKVPKTGKGDSRNAWHTHATGQTLHCTAGYGLVVTDEEYAKAVSQLG